MAPLFKKPKYSTVRLNGARKEIPTGLWSKCPDCTETVHKAQLEENLHVCPLCGFHHRLTCYQRLEMIADPDSFEEMDADMVSVDIIEFVDRHSYADKLAADREKTGLNEAVLCGLAKIEGRPLALAIMDFRFRGASMGSVVGEKIARVTEAATEAGLPLVIIASSGGARMQEGMLSLLQMAKTSGALALHRSANLPYIAVLTNPTTGGVTASFASLGDVILAEPGAYIGFAGMRVIKQTINAELPAGFQTAEFLLSKGLIDRIVPRGDLRSELALLLDYLSPA